MEGCNSQWKLAVAVTGLMVAAYLNGCLGASPAAESTAPTPLVQSDMETSPEDNSATAENELSDSIVGKENVVAIAAGANAFLNLLTESERSSIVYALDDPKRSNWSNLPAGLVRFDRNGIRIGDLNNDQTTALNEFLALSLSADGYRTVMEVVGADGVLAQSSNSRRLRFGADNYWLAFFGQPSATEPWGWQFGGHHLAFNVAVGADHLTMSPTFIGVEPASYATGSQTAAPMEEELQAGLMLINSLAEDQQTAAKVRRRPQETYTGAGKDGVIPNFEGSRVSVWSPGQQQSLLETVALWVGMMPNPSASLRLAEIESDLDETYFAWNGNLDGSGSIYYRIQGPQLIIEFSTQGRVAASGGHYHSVYRDPTNEYGLG